jgi:hypothetical protein
MRIDVSRTTVNRSAGSPSSLLRASPGTLRPARIGCATRSPEGEAWWSQTGSNRRPHACKARALPAELWPQFLRRRPSSPKRASPGTLRFALRGCAMRSRRRSVVGLGRLELPTSRLSSARSNQLSYKPAQEARHAYNQALAAPDAIAQAQAPGACSSAKKEKRRRRNPACGAHPDLAIEMAPDVSKTIR